MQLVFILNKVCSNWMPYMSRTVYQKINHSWHWEHTSLRIRQHGPSRSLLINLVPDMCALI